MTSSMDDVAAQIRAAIKSGEYAAGAPLPSAERLAERFGVHRGTAQKALRKLGLEGWVRLVRRHPAVVIGPPERRVTTRARFAYRDGLGYFFDLDAQNWAPVSPPTSGTAEAPAEVAALIRTPAFYRERLMAPPGAVHAEQVATSYIPVTLLAELPILAAARTGPGGIYDRLEEHFEQPLRWTETVSSRPTTPSERRHLKLSSNSMVLVVSRRSWVIVPEGELTVEVNETRMDASRYAVSYEIVRDASAEWPTRGLSRD